ncbi:MAG: M20/M25/M40 family metallo-hydrolase [bacterium]|nr:M20/M25/M40 family metallo-hydrolase [bacterium]
MKDLLFSWVERNRDWTLNVLEEYLKIPSVSATGEGIKEAQGFLLNLLNGLGFKTRLIETKGNSLVYAEFIVDETFKTILFYNHYDVQPAEPLDEWISPPFSLTERDGKLFARGASDNKGSLMARIAAIKAFIDEKVQPPVNVKFIIDGEEEIGSPNLSEAVENSKDLLKADLCIWENGSKDEEGRPEMILGCKGIVHAELKAEGGRQDIHSSLGTMIPNPSWRLVWALASLKDKDEKILIDGFYDEVIPLGDEEKEYIRHIPFDAEEKLKLYGLKEFILGLADKRLLLHHLSSPGLNICGLSSGYEGPGHKSIIPKEAWVKLDFRLVPDQKPEDILRRLRAHLDKHGFHDIKIENAGGYPPARTDVNHLFVRLVAEATKEVYGKDPIIYPWMAASGPMYLFTQRMPCVSAGVGNPESNIHSPNESIYIEDLFQGVRHIIQIMIRLRTTTD